MTTSLGSIAITRHINLGRNPVMTIAAGFRCRDGVIIAADERITELNVERNQKKLLDCSRIPGCFVKLAPAGDFEAASTCAELMRENGCFNEVAAESIRALKSAL